MGPDPKWQKECWENSSGYPQKVKKKNQIPKEEIQLELNKGKVGFHFQEYKENIYLVEKERQTRY